MPELSTLYDIQTPVEAVAARILTIAGYENIYTTRLTGSKDDGFYIDLTAGGFIPNGKFKISGSNIYPEMFNGELNVSVATERKNIPQVSHSMAVSQIISNLQNFQTYNTSSLMPNHLMCRTVFAGVTTNTDEAKLLNMSNVKFTIVVGIRPEVWP